MNTETGLTDATNGWHLRAGKRQGINNGQVYRAVLKVRAEHVSAFLDGDLIAELQTNGDRLSIGPEPKIGNLPVLQIAVAGATMTIRELQVVEISGHGTVLAKSPSAK